MNLSFDSPILEEMVLHLFYLSIKLFLLIFKFFLILLVLEASEVFTVQSARNDKNYSKNMH